MSLRDLLADVAHDLLDVHLVAARRLIRWRLLLRKCAPVAAPTFVATTAAMEVTPAAV
jgi:hypothetical protein